MLETEPIENKVAQADHIKIQLRVQKGFGIAVKETKAELEWIIKPAFGKLSLVRQDLGLGYSRAHDLGLHGYQEHNCEGEIER